MLVPMKGSLAVPTELSGGGEWDNARLSREVFSLNKSIRAEEGDK